MSCEKRVCLRMTPEQAEALFRLVDEHPENLPLNMRVSLRAAMLGALHLTPRYRFECEQAEGRKDD